MAASHRAACERLVSLAPQSEAYGPTIRTAIGTDESVLHPALGPTLRGLLRDVPDVIEVSTLWVEVRERRTEAPILVGGGSPTKINEGMDWGIRRKGDSEPDSHVVDAALVRLYWYRRIVVLSANRWKDAEGLRRILERDVEPVLNRDKSHGLALVLFLQKRRTPMDAYARAVDQYVRAAPFIPGFHEEHA